MPLEPYLRGTRYWCRGYPADGDEYVRKSLGTSDEAIAQAACREIEAAYRKRRILGPDAPKPEDEITFAVLIMLYDATPAEAGYLKKIVRHIGKERVRNITPQSIRALAKKMLPMASTDTWIRQIVTPIRSVINNGHELGKCPPIRVKAFSKDERIKQDRLRGKESRVPKVPGSWPWLLAFIEAADPRDGALAYFMFRHGARVGQSVAMRRATDMDLSAARLRVPAAKGHPAEWVDIDPELVVMIANIPRPYRAEARGRVFGIGSSRAGSLRKRWKATCERAGIEYLPPHSSGRHGFGTEMFVRQAGNVDPVSAAKEGRWSSPTVPLKTYAHAEDSAVKVRDAFMAGKRSARTPSVQRKTKKALKAAGNKVTAGW
jgi:integrase